MAWFSRLLLLFFLFSRALQGRCWISPATTSNGRTVCLQMNLLSDLGDMLSGGKLVPQSTLPHGTPLVGSVTSQDDVDVDTTRTWAIQERAISFTGEDFDVFDGVTQDRVACVSGAMLHLPGKDKLTIKTSAGQPVVELERKLVAMTPTYEIFRKDTGEKLGWMEKKKIALTDTFELFLEGQGFGPFKSPVYRIEGDFIDRRFVMKNDEGEVVAKFSKDGIIQFDAFNHYQVQIAPGMDAFLVVACACAIDEEFDEEHRERKKKEEERG